MELLVIIAIVAVLTAVAYPNLFPLKGRAKLQADWSQLVDQLSMYRARAINTGKVYSVCPTTTGRTTTLRAYFHPGGCGCSGGGQTAWSTDAGESISFEDVIISQCSLGSNGPQSCTPVPQVPTDAPICFYGDGHAAWNSGNGTLQLEDAGGGRPLADCSQPSHPDCYGKYAVQVHVATGFFDKFQLTKAGQWKEMN